MRSFQEFIEEKSEHNDSLVEFLALAGVSPQEFIEGFFEEAFEVLDIHEHVDEILFKEQRLLNLFEEYELDVDDPSELDAGAKAEKMRNLRAQAAKAQYKTDPSHRMNLNSLTKAFRGLESAIASFDPSVKNAMKPLLNQWKRDSQLVMRQFQQEKTAQMKQGLQSKADAIKQSMADSKYPTASQKSLYGDGGAGDQLSPFNPMAASAASNPRSPRWQNWINRARKAGQQVGRFGQEFLRRMQNPSPSLAYTP